MAPRPTVRRERNSDYSAVGTAGRRTGVTLPQARLDENGLEEITGLFSSPSKPSPVKQNPGANDNDAQNSTFEASEDMSGMDSSGLTPTQTLSARRSLGAPALPPPRSASPRKSGINGTARRSNGIDILSPSKSAQPTDPEDRENSPTPTPIRMKPRRFVPSPEKRPLNEVIPNGMAVNSRPMKEIDMPVGLRATSETAAVQSGRETLRGQATEEGSEHFDTKSNQKPNASVEDEDENSVQNPIGDDEMEEFLSGVGNAIQDVSPVRNATTEIAPKTTETVVESIEPEQPAEGSQKPAVQRKNARKRKSDEMEEPAAPSQRKPAKKPRMTKAEAQKAKALQRIGPSVSIELSTKPLPAQEAPKVMPVRVSGLIKDPNTHLSQRQQAELDQIIEKVKARPGKLKTLYVLKREKSKKSGANDVRSGRAVVKPLAYWSAEQCVHNEGEASLELGSRIPLNSIKEISLDTKKTQSNEDSDNDDAASLNNHHEDGHEEAWEKEIGIFRGHTNIWSQSDQATLEEAEETDLAYHPSSVLTREVNGSGYKFAKLVSMPFFSSGIVDLPPGAVKRPKNSRTMHMCFFVFKGRVTVSIGQGIGGEEGEEAGERFSVGKGGVFQVPRGNKYSIENVLEKPARIFFSQGCETVSET